MLTYRCNILDESGGIKNFVEVYAFGDAEAITEAQRHPLLASRVFEVWRGLEMIYQTA